MNDATTPDTPGQPQERAPHQRRWPRRLAIGLAVTGALMAAGYWYLGRESTLQMLVQRVANASGGSIVVTGVTGSLYSSMHMDKVVFKSPEQLITAENLDIDWSPFQYLTKGIAINKLHVMSLRMDTLKESEKAKMPVSLEAPFMLQLNDARINKVTMTNQGVSTVIADVRFNLNGDKQKWTIDNGSAITPWGYAKAAGSIEARRPFKLDARASLTQLVPKGQDAAQVNLHATGNLETTELAAVGRSGRATGDARLTLSPYSDIALRAMAINGQNLDPGFFNPNLPTADLSVTIAARVDDKRNVKGSVNIVNQGPVGTIDQQLLPLRAVRGDLSGDLSALKIDGAVIDFGEAGKFTGGGDITRPQDEKAPPTANFALHTDRLDLKQLHSRMKTTKIAGDISLSNVNETQTLSAKLVEAGMRLDANATLANNVLKISKASITAGGSNVSLAGNASLAGNREFKVTASADNFNPASFGDYPAADINAAINANGFLAPEWRLAADFALRPSRLFGQALSGKGKFDANAKHVNNVQATLALGNNSADIRGAFGAPGEKLLWRVEGRQLGALRDNMYGTLVANGAVTGTMAMPRTSFVVDAKGLGWAPKVANAGTLRASGDAWLTAPAKDGSRSVEVKATGAANQFNPAAFGSFLPGSINATFSAAGTAAKDWRGNLNLALQPSTLGTSPLTGYAKLAADSRHVSNADIDLRLGVNSAVAKGSFGAAGDALNFRIDAPQLAALGPNFAGAMRGAGTLSGSMEAPAVNATLDGQNLKFFGQHSIASLKASANVGSGRGAADPLVADIEVAGYAMGDRRIDLARLQTTGTRGAHTMRFSGRNAAGDASGEIRGGLSGNVWTGTVASLQNKGRYAFTLQAPVPVRIAGAPGSGPMGLMSPAAISVRNAVIALPAGSINLVSLDKAAGRWTSKGAAAGVPLNYLAQFSPAMRNNLAGDLTIGGDWALDMRAPAVKGAPPALSGSVHVFREKGDLIVGNEVPVVLGLRTLDMRADVVGGALRTQVRFDGAKAGQATIDATTTLVQGRLTNASPLRMTANADMTSIAWMAPLAGQPGLELDGSLKMGLTGGGTVGKPTLNGNINGDNLAVRWAEQGVKLRNGQLRAQLAGDQLLLQRLAFDGVQGRATADGNVRFSGGEATMQLKLVADKLEILSRPDRTLVITGQSTLLRDAKRFALEGKFRADRALIELAPQGRPTLSDDVIVLGRTAAATTVEKDKPSALKSMPLAMDMELDLGDYFRLRGMGIDAELNGQVNLRGTSAAPRANGGIRVVSGTYKAYGQNLTIERGVLTFSGRVDNPALNIRAVRRRPEGEQLSETNVEAGVEVRGTALSPVAKLVSTPNVPDSEKLAWLVLGHGMDAVSGNEKGVLTAAAGALLGGKGGGFQSRLANSLGVDELGLSSADGLESTVVTVGKRLSSRAYLSFEQGATTASSLVKLRYKLTPKITLQFQTGTNTALDVLYTWAYD